MRKEDLNCSKMLVLHVDANALWQEVNPWLAKRPLKTNGRLANR